MSCSIHAVPTGFPSILNATCKDCIENQKNWLWNGTRWEFIDGMQYKIRTPRTALEGEIVLARGNVMLSNSRKILYYFDRIYTQGGLAELKENIEVELMDGSWYAPWKQIPNGSEVPLASAHREMSCNHEWTLVSFAQVGPNAKWACKHCNADKER